MKKNDARVRKYPRRSCVVVRLDIRERLLTKTQRPYPSKNRVVRRFEEKVVGEEEKSGGSEGGKLVRWTMLTAAAKEGLVLLLVRLFRTGTLKSGLVPLIIAPEWLLTVLTVHYYSKNWAATAIITCVYIIVHFRDKVTNFLLSIPSFFGHACVILL